MVEAALKGDRSRCRVGVPAHFAVELRYRKHPDAYRASFYPGAQVLGAHELGFETDNFFEVLRFFQFCLA